MDKRKDRVSRGNMIESKRGSKHAEEDINPGEILVSNSIFFHSPRLSEENIEDELFKSEWEPEAGFERIAGVVMELGKEEIQADASDFTLFVGDEVVVSTWKGIEIGKINRLPRWIKTDGMEVQGKILRLLGHSDFRQMSRNRLKEQEALEKCRKLVQTLKLDMKILSARYLHGGGRIVFYFTAHKRVDFRRLLKELHNMLHVKVELKQIGVRDAIRIDGGVGPCGCEVCCNRFLPFFKPVSVRMVKEQNLIINPQKISGLCGRLMCCIEYEHEDYKEKFYRLPAVGQVVKTPDGEAEVVDLDILGEEVKVMDKDGNVKWWKNEKLTFTPAHKEIMNRVDEEFEVEEDEQ